MLVSRSWQKKGGKLALSLQEYEELAETVREYPCLYDKTKKECKNKIVTENAWKGSC